jgi:hypothetical protein
MQSCTVSSITAARTPVESSAVASIGYSDSAGALDVEFHNGGVYRYVGVPRSVFDAFSAAESKGAFLNQRIKPKFRCVRL